MGCSASIGPPKIQPTISPNRPPTAKEQKTPNISRTNEKEETINLVQPNFQVNPAKSSSPEIRPNFYHDHVSNHFSSRSSFSDIPTSVGSMCSFGQLISQNNHLRIYEYTFGKLLGKGSMSRVYQVNNDTNETYAAKVYSKSRLLKPCLGHESLPFNEVQTEINIMCKINNPHILTIREVIEDHVSDSLILILPLAKYGTLTNYTKLIDLTENDFKFCFYQIIQGLENLHASNIVHRDIKPENILVFAPDDYKISDFSASTILPSENAMISDTKGSPAFLSPEECTGEPFDPKASDVWALGISIYYMSFKILPFNLSSINSKPMLNAIYLVTKLLQTQKLIIPNSASPDLQNLLRALLQKDPLNRPKMSEILNFEWFNDVNNITPSKPPVIEYNEFAPEVLPNSTNCMGHQIFH